MIQCDKKVTQQHNVLMSMKRDAGGYFEYKQLDNGIMNNNNNMDINIEEEIIAFIEKINTILDFKILTFELKFFKSIILAGI